MNNRQLRQLRDINLENFLEVVKATVLTPRNLVVHAVTEAGQADYAITLPPVAEAVECLISISLVTLGDDEVVTVQDQDDSYDWADLTLDTLNDGVLLYCDGIKFWVICNDIAV